MPIRPPSRPLRAILSAGTAVLALSTFSEARAVPLEPLERELRDGRAAYGQADGSARRLALVLGVGDYAYVSKLRNPRGDAQAIAALLRQHGFEVIEGYDLDKLSIEALLRDAVIAGGPSAETVFFFSGHGVQIADKNYLLPIEARLSDATDLPFQTVTLENVLSVLQRASGKHLSFIDSCRNNPFEGGVAVSTVRGSAAPIRGGFSQPVAPPGALLAYATQPGALALDGAGAHSPYTEALTFAAAQSPQADIDTLLSAVRGIVESTTGGQQSPSWVSALSTSFVLADPPKPLRIDQPVLLAATPQLAPIPAPVPQPLAPAGVVAVPTGAVAVTMPVVGAVQSAGGTGAVSAPLERLVALGQRLLRILGLGAGAQVRIAGGSAPGALGLLTRSGKIDPLRGRLLSGAELSALVLGVDSASARRVSRSTGMLSGSVALDITDARGTYRRNVPISLFANACDAAAGDWFDPQGVGIHRIDSAIDARAAVAACEASLAGDPSSARFRYQLGRALLAAGRRSEAEAAFLRAAQEGHARGWLGYGALLEARGDVPGALSAYRQGEDAGDPLASAALGALELRLANDPATRQAAYERLSEGVDLGLPQAMEALAAYYADPASPDADPRRARRFAQEAERRRNAILPASVTTLAVAPSQTDPRPSFRQTGDGPRESPGRPDDTGEGTGGRDQIDGGQQGTDQPDGGDQGGPAAGKGDAAGRVQ